MGLARAQQALPAGGREAVAPLGFAIVGCGLIGGKRLRALGEHRLVAAVDVDEARAQGLARQRPGAIPLTDWEKAVRRADVDCVIVSTTHDQLARVTLAAVEAGKHVLVEKPVARSLAEIEPVIAAAERQGVRVQAGFNHRFHPGFLKARELVDAGDLGPLMFIRARYGHGGRAGYHREWRADPKISGGGELLDQGMHLIDLARWFAGDFTAVDGSLHTYFWDMPVEDNAFLHLKTARGQVAWLHASWTEWKNTFSFELFYRDAKLHVEGLGGSYGVERLSCYRMRPEMGPPETSIWEYPGEDRSWDLEFEAFVRSIREGRDPAVTLKDAAAALEIVGRVSGVSKA